MLHRELYRFFRGALEMIDRPIFYQPPNGAGAEESGRFNGHPNALRDFYDRPNIIFVGSRGAVRLDLHPVGGDFLRQRFGMRRRARSRARQPNVYGINA